MDAEERRGIEAQWLELTRVRLPAMAAARGWPVREDHCFQRILLDHACGGCWYASVRGRPAYRAASGEILRGAVEAGEAVAAGTADLHQMNVQSLAWRRKL